MDSFVSVPEMPAPRPRTAPARRRPPRRRSSLRVTRAVWTILLLVAVLVVLLVSAFGSPRAEPVPAALPAPPADLLPSGPPAPLVVSRYGDLRIQLPIAQSHVTAIGYHAAGDSVLPLEPLGRQGNEGVLARLGHRIFGGGHGAFVYYQLGGGEGSSTGELDVGAAPGTQVYAPVDGTVVAISDFVLDGRPYGSRVDVQPSSAPSLVLSLTHVRPDSALTVGSAVSAAQTRIGTVVDVSGAQRQALRRYTQDAGNHVALSLHPAATLSIP